MRNILIAMLLCSMVANAQERWSLEKCISHAIENNISIKQQQNAIERSEIELNTAKMNLLPSVNASASQSWSFGRGLTMDNTYVNRNTASTSFDISGNVTLFAGMQKINSIKARKLNLEAATADLQRVKEDMSINVAQAYLQTLYAAEMLQVAKRQVELSKNVLEQKQKMMQNGKASESDVAEARAAVSRDELSIVQAENDYNLALLDLSQLLELPSPENFVIEEPDTAAQLMAIATIDEVYADALRNKAIIKGDETRIVAAEKSVSIARGGHSPTLNLSGGVGTNYYKTSGYTHESFGYQLDQNLSKYVALSLNIPIFNRFATRNEVRTARCQVENLNMQLNADKKALYKEVQQAYYNAVASESKYGSSLSAEESAQVAFNLVTKKFDNGKATQTEYDQSRTQWLKAVADRIQAKYEYIFRAKILEYYRGNGDMI